MMQWHWWEPIRIEGQGSWSKCFTGAFASGNRMGRDQRPIFAEHIDRSQACIEDVKSAILVDMKAEWLP